MPHVSNTIHFGYQKTFFILVALYMSRKGGQRTRGKQMYWNRRISVEFEEWPYSYTATTIVQSSTISAVSAQLTAAGDPFIEQWRMEGCLFSILWIEPYPEEFTYRDILRQDWFSKSPRVLGLCFFFASFLPHAWDSVFFRTLKLASPLSLTSWHFSESWFWIVTKGVKPQPVRYQTRPNSM